MYAAKMGNEAVGISFNRLETVKATRRAALLGLSNTHFAEGDLRRLAGMSEALGTFDQVICCETIEHILDDSRLVRDLAALLRSGGQLLLTRRFKYLFRLPGDNKTIVVTQCGRICLGKEKINVSQVFAGQARRH